MAKLLPLKFLAVCFADGPRGSYFQEWQCQKYPSLFVRVIGSKKEKPVRLIFVKKPDLEVLEFKSVEEAIPSAKKYHWNFYEPISFTNTGRKDIQNKGLLVLDKRKKKESDKNLPTHAENRQGAKASRNLDLRKRKRVSS